jgi:transposase
MKTFFIGVDISKSWLDTAICDGESKQVLNSFNADNSLPGIDKMFRKVRKQTKGSELWFCFEHTGNYGLLLASQLESLNLNYSAVPALEIKHSQGMSRGKNDQVDAKRIAIYAATHAHKLTKSQLPGKELLKIKTLLTYRAQLVRFCSGLQNSRKSYLITQASIDVTSILKDIDLQIETLKKRIKELEQEAEKLIEADDNMLQKYVKIRTVKGIGLLIAAYMLVYTNNFTSFDNPRKFNCYAGLAPFENRSGSSIEGKTKTSRLRNKTIKTLLFNGANTAAMYDHELKAYTKRKKAEGKAHQSVMNAVACKLVYRMFAVVKRNEPYVNLMR